MPATMDPASMYAPRGSGIETLHFLADAVSSAPWKAYESRAASAALERHRPEVAAYLPIEVFSSRLGGEFAA